MLLISVLIVLMLVPYMIIGRKNKYVYIMGVYFFCIIGLIYVSVLYMAKVSNYYYPMDLDYSMYLRLLNLKINIYSISIIYNTIMSVFFGASLWYSAELKRYSVKKIIMFIIPIVLFWIINNYKVGITINYRMYEGGIIWNFIGRNIPRFNNCIMVLYIVMPIWELINFIVKTRIKMQKLNGIMMLICLLSIYFLIFYMFSRGFFILLNNVSLIKFPDNSIGVECRMIYPLILVLVIGVVVFGVMLLRPFENNFITSKYAMAKNARCVNNNFGMILHKYKNAFICIMRFADLAENGLDKDNYENVRQCVDLINELSFENVNSLKRIIGTIRKTGVSLEKINLYDFLSDIVQQTGMDGIIIDKTGLEKELYINGDIEMLRETFLNIFENAAYALKESKKEKKVITVFSELENPFHIIYIRDNGTGIEKKKIKHIFDVFYSTKEKAIGTGVGLAYAKKILKAHGGDIEAKSVYGEYTEFAVIFPTLKTKRNLWGKRGRL